ncbi:hypothetical protein A3715_36130 [Oleiphilus sp. HI0009]|nr:hypothetical protein A3715_36130 [Oleiphilus sp. HI0009]
MKDVFEFLQKNLSSYVDWSCAPSLSKINDTDAVCSKCGSRSNLYSRPSKAKSKTDIICSGCAFFDTPLPMHSKNKSVTIKQKDTLLIVSERKAIIQGDINASVFSNSSHIDLITRDELESRGMKSWRNVLFEYLLFDHIEPAVIIFQSKADKSDTFCISHSPHFANICGQINERVNLHRARKSYQLLKDITSAKWIAALQLKEESYFKDLSDNKKKLFGNAKNKYPQLFTSEADLILPLPRSFEQSVVSYGSLRDSHE